MNKYSFLTVFVAGVLMAGFFCLGRYSQHNTVVVSPFSALEHDSLGVYEVSGPTVYVSDDNQLQVRIWMVSLDDKDYFFTLQLSGDPEIYHGADNENFDPKKYVGMQVFEGEHNKAPIRFYQGYQYEGDVIEIENKKIYLTEITK